MKNLNYQFKKIQPIDLLRSLGQIPRRLRRFKDRSSAKIPRLSEAKVEPKREGLPWGILFFGYTSPTLVV